MRNARIILIGIHERNRPLARSRYRWKEDIEMDFKEVRCENVAGFNCSAH
jgi:hypothetical protein